MAPALQKIVVAPTTNPISMLLFSLGGQFENTFLGLGSEWNLEEYSIDCSKADNIFGNKIEINHQNYKSSNSKLSE